MAEGRARWWALGALAVSMLTIGLDTTVLNVALPTLSIALRASSDQLQWFSAAYTLVLAAVLLPGGALGDRYGRKRLLLIALIVFGAASVACAYAGSASVLIAARAVLGLGAAVMMPLSMAVLTVLFPDREERGRALTIWVTSTVIGIPLGPIVGGWLLDTFWWGSVFLINVPLVIVGVAAVAMWVPESRSAVAARLDLIGVALSSTGLVAITYGFIEAGRLGWSAATAWAPILAGVALLASFVAWQRRVRQPLIDLTLFSSAAFSWGTLLSTLVSFAMFGLLFAMPQFFQAVTGVDALGIGLRLLPLFGGLLIGSRLGERIAKRSGQRAVIGAGFALLTLGLAWGATTSTGTDYAVIAAWFVALGAGLGLAMPTAMGLALNELAAERSGSGAALVQALRQVGGTVGVAVLGSVLASGYRSHLDTAGLPTGVADTAGTSGAAGVQTATRLGGPSQLRAVRLAFADGLDAMLWVSAGLAAVGLLLALLVLSGMRRPSAESAAPRPGAAESEHEFID